MGNLGKNVSLVFVALFLISLATVSSAISADTETTWNIQTIVTNLSGSDNFGNMVLDMQNKPHLIYKQVYGVPSNSTIVYVSWNGVSWDRSNVVSNIGLNHVGFLALDSKDYPHISYVTSTPELMYASWIGKTWDIQTVTNSNGAAGGSCYLALDSNNNPHIGYRIIPPMHGYLNYYYQIVYATANEPDINTQPTPIFNFPVMPILAIIGAILFAVVSLLLYRRQRKRLI
jgi:hypothetical protein